MSEVQDCACPLCKSVAKAKHHTMVRSRHYLCPSCGDLVIKEYAEKWLNETTPQGKEAYISAAKQCPAGNVLFISRSTKEGRTTYESLSLNEALRR